jgi:hypothetical protein
LATTTVLLALVPLAAAEDPDAPVDAEWKCVPGVDRTANAASANGATYYNRLYQNSNYHIEEVWQETNGEGGLQTSAGMSCVAKADKLVRSVCIGYCPLSF